MASRAGNRRRQQAGRDQVQQRYRAVFSGAHSGAIPGAILKRGGTQVRRRAGDRIRNGNEYMAAAALVASRLRERMFDPSHTALSAGGNEGWLRCSEEWCIGV